MQLPADDSQVEMSHILDLHRAPAGLKKDHRPVYEPTATDYTASSNDPSGTGDGGPKPEQRKPETY